MPENIILFIAVGFFAQMIDGALGMAYKVICTTFLFTFGISPAVASASVHAAGLFTSAVSGYSHWKLGNVDRALWIRLLVPGVIGGGIGAYLLTNIPGQIIKPFITAYLLIMGIVILFRALRKGLQTAKDIPLVPLGIFGGMMDALGGGGWGPIVTSTLIANGNSPRMTIGSVNLAEFFVTFTQSVVFILTIGLTHWYVILGLLIGGVFAAPLAALVCRKIPSRSLMIVVGVLIILLSLRTLLSLISG